MKKCAACFVVLSLLLALPPGIRAAAPVTAKNPDPKRLPSLRVYCDDKFSRDKPLTMVAATFPNIPDFTCDAWCYEARWTSSLLAHSTAASWSCGTAARTSRTPSSSLRSRPNRARLSSSRGWP